MMEKKAHWILVHFDIKRGRLLVYNSSRMTVRDRIVTSNVEAFAHVLPCLMVKMNAYEVKTIDEIERVEPLKLKVVNCLNWRERK